MGHPGSLIELLAGRAVLDAWWSFCAFPYILCPGSLACSASPCRWVTGCVAFGGASAFVHVFAGSSGFWQELPILSQGHCWSEPVM